MYELGWIRMLSLVLGTSTHAFELMLSAFILGLAFGGLFIQRRIDAVPSPLRTLGRVQVLQKIVDAARFFRPRVDRAFADPRSHVYIDDAKTFFSAHRKKYDLVVSEPSNPWVSGVAGLFSEEFYRTIGRHMNDGALFVQWLQLYEVDVSLVASVVKAMDPSFSDYVVYASNDNDLVIVATRSGAVGAPSSTRARRGPAFSRRARTTSSRSCTRPSTSLRCSSGRRRAPGRT
jgi:spermidine synthase